MIVVRYNGRFVTNEDGSWEYINGRNKARVIRSNCTYEELQEIVYEVTKIDRNSFRIVMKYLFHSCYKLDPIEIEDNGDVQCFLKEQFRVDTQYRSPLYIEVVENISQNVRQYEGDKHITGLSGSKQDENIGTTPLDNREYEIPANEIGGSAPANMHDGAYISEEDVAIPTSNENVHFNNVDEYGFNDEDDFIDNDDIHLEHDGDGVNAPVEVPIMSEGFATVESTQVPCAPLPAEVPVEVHSHTTPCPTFRVDRPSRADRASRVDSGPSTSNVYPISSTNAAPSSTTEIEVGQIYANKKELQKKCGSYALDKGFEFKVKKSCSQRYEIGCVDDSCPWRIRAARIEGLELFSIRVFKHEHKCSAVENMISSHRQATSRLIGDQIKQKYDGIARQYRPREIIFDWNRQHGIKISYEKAWRAREFALESIRGSPEESYHLLPLWSHMLEQKNPGSMTRIETDSHNCFLYFFMALGQSIAGFNKLRPVVVVDGTHLKGKYKGTLFVAACLDGNEQIYPLAFGVGDTENEQSYTWFFERFKEAYGEVPNLVFISDRHKGLERAIATVDPNAHHGHCMYHLRCNVKQHFGKNKHVHMAFFQAAKAYLHVDFDMHMRHLANIDIRAHRYVMEANPEKWARSHFPGMRYNIMTTNIAECMNGILRDARSLPIVPLLESIRALIQDWFYNRRNQAEATTTAVTPWLEKKLKKRLDLCVRMDVTPLNMYEFEVRGCDFRATVNLENKTCSCREFELDHYPCVHAAAACRFRNISFYLFCSEYYTVSAWRDCYAPTIYPLDDRRLWQAPPEITDRVVLPPNVRRAPGRPRTQRILSRGEDRPHRRCSRCKVLGHNRQTCTGNAPLH